MMLAVGALVTANAASPLAGSRWCRCGWSADLV